MAHRGRISNIGHETWWVLRTSVMGFINDNALSHGAAMSFYATTSLAPVLLIVVAIAGLAFGHDAARVALAAEVSGLMGPQSADLLQAAIESASHRSAGTLATLVGIATLFITASGVFGEMQLALNQIWRVELQGTSISRLVRARIASLGLVAALGFLLIVSLVASAVITAFGQVINSHFSFGAQLLGVIDAIVSFLLLSAMFAAIYKLLPDRSLQWRDVGIGALVTAFLFTIGKSLIGWYIGTTDIASSYGAAGALLIVLLWVYYSSEIFLFGAEITRAYSVRHGSRSDLKGIGKDPEPSRTFQPAVEGSKVNTGALLGAMVFAGLAMLVVAGSFR